MGEGVTIKLGAETTDLANLFAIQLGDDEPSFVKVFKLPDWSGPYSIQVTSNAYGGMTDPALFYPRYLFLDKNHGKRVSPSLGILCIAAVALRVPYQRRFF